MSRAICPEYHKAVVEKKDKQIEDLEEWREDALKKFSEIQRLETCLSTARASLTAADKRIAELDLIIKTMEESCSTAEARVAELEGERQDALLQRNEWWHKCGEKDRLLAKCGDRIAALVADERILQARIDRYKSACGPHINMA